MAIRLLLLCTLFLWPVLPAGWLCAQTASVVPAPTTLAAAGGTVSFSVQLNYTGDLSALGFRAVLPAGWTFGATGGNQVPQIGPQRGDRGLLEFAWFVVPTGPASFTFTADYPAGLTTAQTVSGLAATYRRPGSGAAQFAVSDVVFPAPGAAAVVKLVNISTRSRTGTAAETLIAGFFLAGDRPQTVLVRGIGPTLAAFGVGGALPAARLELFRDQTRVTVGDDWGAAPNRDAVAGAAAAVGAFALAPASRDAAVLVTLEPGAYTAVVSGQGGAFAFARGSADAALLLTLAPGGYTARVAGTAGATGTALVEVYEVP